MIGKVIKIFAVIFLVATLGLLIFAVGNEYSYYQRYDWEDAFFEAIMLPMLLGVFSILFVFCMLYGFGSLIDTNASIDRKMDRLLTYMRQNQSAPQAPVQPAAPAYRPPVQPAAPVKPVAPVYQPPVQPAPAVAEPVVEAPVVVEPVVEAPVPEAPTVTGWKCDKCGTQIPTLTAFCRTCGNKRV